MNAAIIDAGIILFGAPARSGGAAFLAALEPAAVRRAYRTLAVASHPDAARRGGRRGSIDGQQFIEASRAYGLLMDWVLKTGTTTRITVRKERPRTARPKQDRARGAGPGTKPGGARAPTAGSSSPLFYRGAAPRRRLRLAEYLYYTGRVSWRSMIKAIVWQNTVQPRFGEIARELSRISGADLWRILGSKLRHEQTGEAAQRLRMLSAAEVERILRLQRLRHRRIGAYFMEEERMTGDTLSELLRELHRHNARYGPAARA